MNYSELVQRVKDFLETDETTFNDNIDDFINLAEETIYRSVHIPHLKKNVTSAFTLDDQYLATPTDFLAPFSLAVDQGGGTGYLFLINKDVNFIREAFPVSTSTGVPKYYGLFDDDTFIVGPTPDTAYAVELHYYFQPIPISATNTTTWLGDNAENALFYGTLVEAYTFLKGDPDLLQLYIQHATKAMEDLRILGEGFDEKDDYRHGRRRVGV